MKLDGCQMRRPTHKKELFAIVHCLDKTKVYPNNMSLKYNGRQIQVSANILRWHDTLALMRVDLIHKPGYENVVSDVLSRHEEF